MKIIIFLVLAGLSLAQDINPFPTAVSSMSSDSIIYPDMKCQKGPKDKRECLIYALENDKDFPKILHTFVCRCTGFGRYNGICNEAFEDMIRIMDRAGCNTQDITEAGHVHRNCLIGHAIGLAEAIANNQGRSLAAIGISPALAIFSCYMVMNKSSPECLANMENRIEFSGALKDKMCAKTYLTSKCLLHILKGNSRDLISEQSERSSKGDLSVLTKDYIMGLAKEFGCPDPRTITIRSIIFHRNKGRKYNLTTSEKIVENIDYRKIYYIMQAGRLAMYLLNESSDSPCKDEIFEKGKIKETLCNEMVKD